jgi:ABC-type multidrug transport system fused ATPase/permease subunit
VWALLTSAERRTAVWLVISMLFGMLLETLGVSAVVPALALLTQPDYLERIPALQSVPRMLGNPDQATLVIGGMAVLVAVYLVKTLFLGVLAWQQTSFAFRVQAQLSQRLFTVYLRQPYTFHLQRNSAQLIRNAINEVAQFSGNAMIPGMQLLTEVLVLAGLCTLLFVVEPVGASIIVGVLAGATWLFHHVTRKHILRWGQARLRHDGLRFQHLQQGLGGVKDVKLLGREREFLDRYQAHNLESARAGHLQKTLQQFPRLWLELLAVAGFVALVLSILAQGHAIETVLPTLGMFAAAAFRTLPSVNRVISAVQSVRYGLPVIDTLYTELQLDAPAPARAGPTRALHDSLQIDCVDFTYPATATPALRGLSMSVRRGESVGIIGPSGAGKSTLVDILLGLLRPDRGEVRVDGLDIHSDLRSWQDQIGYVPQSIFLTDDSLRRNVAFGLPDSQIDEQAVLRAIRAAQLESFVRELPAGLETLVGERGIRLSGGQRQRIGIARALYHDPAVLVLDEATSSLDATTEHGVMDAVEALQGQKTIVVVAHRLSTVQRCSRLYRLEAGAIVQEGSAGEVLAGPLRLANEVQP